MATKNESRYWTSIKPNDYVNLTDLQSFSEAGTAGVDYRVSDVRRIGIVDQESGRAIAEYHLHDLEQESGADAVLAVVTTQEEFELRIYYVPGGFLTGTRDQLIDAGQTWFFLPPPNPEDFISSELEYAPYPDVPPIEENGATVRRDFEPFGFGKPVYGEYSRNRSAVPVILTEYATADESAANNLILVLEERWILADGTIPEEGGIITPMLGCRIDPGSIELYPA